MFLCRAFQTERRKDNRQNISENEHQREQVNQFLFTIKEPKPKQSDIFLLQLIIIS
jgi:hypothetical protein